MASRAWRWVVCLSSALLALLTISRASMAEPKVAVIAAQPPDPFMDELFYRLRGEFQVHGFALVDEDGTRASSSLQGAQRILERTGASACVFLSRRGETSVVHLWVSGTERAPVLFEAVAFERTAETPTVLAVRSVDLLTLALGTKSASAAVSSPAPAPPPPPAPQPPEAKVAVAPSLPVPESKAPESAIASRPRGAVSIDVGAGMSALFSSLGAGVGPEVRLRVGPPGRLRGMLNVTGPLWGAEREATLASAKIVMGYALTEVGVDLLHAGPVAVALGAGAGVFYVRAKSTLAPGISSLEAGSDARAVFVGTLSGELSWALGARAALVAEGRALVPLPRVQLRLGSESIDGGAVAPALGLSLRFAL